jgi:ABC-type nitrate/sulfonate/bicarbonate transport system permease component
MSHPQASDARITPATADPATQMDGATPKRRPTRRRNPLSVLSGVALIVVLAVLWELSVRLEIIQSPNWPALSDVFVSFWALLRDGTFVTVFGPTLQRLAEGYALAAVMGIGLGLAMGYFRWIHRLLDPIVEVLRPIPSPAYIPVAILFLGIGDTMKIFMIAFSAFFPILLNTVAGVRSVDPVLIDTGRTFGLGTRQIVRKIVLPSALVYIFTGLRISLAIALILTVIAEEVAGNSGIGFYLLNAQRSFLIPEMYASVVALAILGFALNKLFLLIESKVLSWDAGSQRSEIT